MVKKITKYIMKIMIFSCYSILAIKKIKDILCAIEIFTVLKYIYYQFYTISYIIGSPVFPAIFAIIKNTSRKTYEDLFRYKKKFNLQ